MFDKKVRKIWGLFLIVVGLVVAALVAASGVLTFIQVQKDATIDGLNRANSVLVSPDGQHIYVAGGQDDAVAVFSRNETTGELTFVEIQKDGVNGVDGLDLTRTVTVSPNGRHVYATGEADSAWPYSVAMKLRAH